MSYSEDDEYDEEEAEQPPVRIQPQQKKTDQYRPLMEQLAKLGGGMFRPEDDIIQQGKQIVIPEGMGMMEAARFIGRRVKADQEANTFTRKYPYRPWDGAVCTWRALKNTFGMVGLDSRTEQGFFGPVKVQAEFRDVPIGYDEVESVPWGAFSLPSFDNTFFQPQAYVHPEFGVLFELHIEGPRKYRAEFEGVFRIVKEELETNSIYRGGAFDGQQMPEFLDLTGVNPDKVIYGEETMVQLEANIWSVLRHREVLARVGISRKRSALLYGPYGTGKTLGGFLTAKHAVENNWTFIYARPGKDDMEFVLQTARLYQPSCVFFEDLDTVADSENVSKDTATKLLDMFDGITAKGTEILVVLTTNHPDRIHKGMLRPGRLDSVIEIGPLDTFGVRKLIQGTVPQGSLEDNVDWDRVFGAAKDMLPAYVKEVGDRAYRYVLARTGKPEGILLSTDDLVHSAEGLRPQLDMMEEANDPRSRDTLAEALSRTVQKTIVETITDDVVQDQAIEVVKRTSDGLRTR